MPLPLPYGRLHHLCPCHCHTAGGGHDTGSGVEALLSSVEAAMLDELNAELREVLGDYRCVYTRVTSLPLTLL